MFHRLKSHCVSTSWPWDNPQPYLTQQRLPEVKKLTAAIWTAKPKPVTEWLCRSWMQPVPCNAASPGRYTHPSPFLQPEHSLPINSRVFVCHSAGNTWKRTYGCKFIQNKNKNIIYFNSIFYFIFLNNTIPTTFCFIIKPRCIKKKIEFSWAILPLFDTITKALLILCNRRENIF